MEFSSFDWDRGNRAKCQKHGLSVAEIEALFSRPLAILPDISHSQKEGRYLAIGKSENGRGVFIAFTFRRKGEEHFIRPISARYMHRKEMKAYEKENPGF